MARSKGEPMQGLTVEELAQMDSILGPDWTDLPDDALVEKIGEALGEIEVAKHSASSMGDFFARLQDQLAQALETNKPPFGQHNLPAPDEKPGGPGFSSTAEPVSGPVPRLNSYAPGASAVDPRVAKNISGFLDSLVGKSKAEFTEEVQKALVGRSGDDREVRKVRSTTPKRIDFAKALDMYDDLTDVQKAAVRAGNPLAWILDAPNGDEELRKNAVTLVGGVVELVKRGRSGGSLTLR